MRVFQDVDFYYLFGILQQGKAIRAQVLQVQFLTCFAVALGDFIQSLYARHIRDPAFGKVNDHFLRIILHIKLFVEGSH